MKKVAIGDVPQYTNYNINILKSFHIIIQKTTSPKVVLIKRMFFNVKSVEAAKECKESTKALVRQIAEMFDELREMRNRGL